MINSAPMHVLLNGFLNGYLLRHEINLPVGLHIRQLNELWAFGMDLGIKSAMSKVRLN